MKKIIAVVTLYCSIIGCGNIDTTTNTAPKKSIEEDKIVGVFYFKAYDNGGIPYDMIKKPLLRVFYNNGTYVESQGRWSTNLVNQKYEYGYVFSLANGRVGTYEIDNGAIIIAGERTLYDYGNTLYSLPFETEITYVGYFLRKTVREEWKRFGYNYKYSNLQGKKPSRNETVIIF